jgi:hypothetical protein
MSSCPRQKRTPRRQTHMGDHDWPHTIKRYITTVDATAWTVHSILSHVKRPTVHAGNPSAMQSEQVACFAATCMLTAVSSIAAVHSLPAVPNIITPAAQPPLLKTSRGSTVLQGPQVLRFYDATATVWVQTRHCAFDECQPAVLLQPAWLC